MEKDKQPDANTTPSSIGEALKEISNSLRGLMEQDPWYDRNAGSERPDTTTPPQSRRTGE